MISFDEVVGINRRVCESGGQRSVILNENNILSALSIQQWYDQLELRSAALIRSLVIGHGFQDGNKRTAAIVGAVVSDYTCGEDNMIDCILAIAKGELKDVDKIASILYPNKD